MGKDPKFRYCVGTNLRLTNGQIWESTDCSFENGGGESGGPAQPKLNGNGKIFSVISASAKLAQVPVGLGPRLFDNSFSCIFEKARKADLSGTNIVEDANGQPCEITEKNKAGCFADPHFLTWTGEYYGT